MISVPCNLQLTEADLHNPGDFLILQPQPASCPQRLQLWVILPGGHLQMIDIHQGVAGNRGWSGNPTQPVLYGAIVTAAWRGWMTWINGVSWLVANP